MKKGKKHIHESMIRSRIKKTRKLPTTPVRDPFTRKVCYINKNGRVIIIDDATVLKKAEKKEK